MNNPFHSQQQAHAVLAQYYRWYQVYEVPFTPQRIANQKDILSDDVEIHSQAGITKGRSDLEERLSVYNGWQNTHHVQKTNVTALSDGQFSLEADIIYQNIRPDESRYSYTIHYAAILQSRNDQLPVFTRLELHPTGVIEPVVFEPAYAENRCKSFMHYWLYLLETAGTEIEPFRELLAPAFNVHLSSGDVMETVEQLDIWLKGIPDRIPFASHSYKNFSVAEQDGRFHVTVDFDWVGINTAGENMIAETHHEWVLENDPDERFARMSSMQISTIRPFQVVGH